MAAASASALAPSIDGVDAQSSYGSWGAFGASVGYAHRINAHWLARMQFNSGSAMRAKGHTTIDGIRYDSSMRTGVGFSTLSDYYPSADSGFHLTAGLVLSQIKPALTGQPNAQGSYSINGHSYTAAQVGTLTAKLKYQPLNLYLGGGWESAPIERKGWRFTSDAGLFTAGKPTVTLEATGAASNAALQSDLDAQRSGLARTGVGLAVQLGAAYSF